MKFFFVNGRSLVRERARTQRNVFTCNYHALESPRVRAGRDRCWCCVAVNAVNNLPPEHEGSGLFREACFGGDMSLSVCVRLLYKGLLLVRKGMSSRSCEVGVLHEERLVSRQIPFLVFCVISAAVPFRSRQPVSWVERSRRVWYVKSLQ